MKGNTAHVQFRMSETVPAEVAASQNFLLEERLAARKTVFFHALGILLAIIFWWVGSSFLSVDFQGFAPVPTLQALVRILPTESFLSGSLETLKRLLGGLGMAIALGVPIGVLVGYVPRANELTYTLFQFLRMISPLSWTPITIILFGVGAGPVYFLVAIAAVWPMILNTAHGVQKVDQTWIKVAQTLGGTRLTIVRRVIVPAVMPDILTGVRLALGVSWIVIVPAEMLGVASGLGYMILNYRDVVDYASLMAVILVIGLIGYGSDALIRALLHKSSWEV